MPRWLWILFVGIVLVAFAGIAWKVSRPVEVDLLDGRRLRIDHVSVADSHVFSREHVIRRVLRRVLPARGVRFLGPPREHRYGTLHSALVIWVTEFNSRGIEVRPSFQSPRTLSNDGTLLNGALGHDLKRQTFLAFNGFARDRKQLQVQLENQHGRIVKFNIRNPARIKPAKWVPLELPQTNWAGPVPVVLRKSAPASLSLSLEPHRKPHWSIWTVTRFDDLGNWQISRVNSRFMSFAWPALPNSKSVVRLVAEGTDYVSAGFVDSPTNGQVSLLDPGMAQDCGVRFLLFVGPGTYEITNGIVSVRPPSTPAGASFLRLAESGTNWLARVQTTMPGILAIVTQTNFVSMRIRERLRNNRGRIFRAPVVMSAPGRNSTALFHLPSLPLVTTNLEVEAIISLPPAEFFLDPSLMPPPRDAVPVPKPRLPEHELLHRRSTTAALFIPATF